MHNEWQRVPMATCDMYVLPSDWSGRIPDEFEPTDTVMLQCKASQVEFKPGMCLAIMPDGRYMVFDDQESFNDYVKH